MSNGEDVLDNWEEIDEAELTNKLQKLEEERKLREKIPETETSKTSTPIVPGKMKLLQRPAQTTVVESQASKDSCEDTSPFDNMQGTFQPVLMVLHKDSDEYQSANYAQPINTQTVKILRRPTQSSEPRNNGVRPKQPIKTLQQREQAYAEARLRILGSAKNPEDDQAANATQPNSPTTAAPAPTPVSTAVAVTFTTSAPATVMSTAPSNAQSKINTPNRPPPPPQPLPQQQQLLQAQAQQPNQIHYGGALNPYNPFYQQQNFYFQKPQQMQQHHTQQQQQQQPLHHSLSSPAFVGGNNRSPFMATSLLPTPPIAPNAVAVSMQNRHQFQQQQQTWSPVVGGSVSSYTLQRQQQRQQQQQQQLDVVRTPRGPDGSTGFQMRR